MFNKMRVLVKRIITLAIVFTCMTLAACNVEKPAEEKEETELYGQTVTQVYSKDNILALTSVRLDTGEQGSRFIMEFDTSSEYVTKEALETALKTMEETPDSFFWGIEGEAAGQVKALGAKVMEKKNLLCVTLLFGSQVECSHVEIKLGNRFVKLDGPWEVPNLQVVDYTYVQDGAEGILYRMQGYDEEEQHWKECRDSFHENQDPISD